MTSHIAFVSLLNDSSAYLPVFIDVAIKGTIVLAGAKILLILRRQASAAMRHLVWSGAVCGLLALPFLAMILPAWRLPILPSLLPTTSASTSAIGSDTDDIIAYPIAEVPRQATRKSSHAERQTYVPQAELYRQNWNSASPLQKSDVSVASTSSSLPALSMKDWLNSIGWESLLLTIWLVGVLVVIARVVVGIAGAWWLAKGAERITEVSWEMMSHNLSSILRLRKSVALLRSGQVTLPMTCGAFRSAVLLPEESDQWSLRCRRIVLLHELAHVKRRDCLTQLLAQLACAFYWFNPLAWAAARQLRVERELACDDQVLEAGTRASDYASYLVEIAGAFGAQAQPSPVSVGMACSELESRVRAILNAALPRKSLHFSQVLLVSLCAACLILPLAVVQPRVKAQERLAVNTSKIASSSNTDSTQEDENFTDSSFDEKQRPLVKDDNKHKPSVPTATETGEHQNVKVRTNQSSATVTDEVDDGKDRDNEQDSQEDSKTNEKRSANPSPDDLIQMRVHNITSEYIESVRKLGFENLSINRLVEMRIHNINEEFIKEARSWGYDNLTVNQLIQLRIAGVTADYIAAMKRIGFNNLAVNKLASMRMQGVTPEYIESMRRLGFDNLSAEQLLSLRVHGITEEFVRNTETWGYGKLSLNDLLQVKMFNVTPAFAQEMKSIGFDNLPLKKLIQMKLHGVTVDYIKEMRGLGLENLTADQLIQMRIHGVDADYVRRLRAAGFKNVSVNQMIEMRISGVDEILLKKSQ